MGTTQGIMDPMRTSFVRTLVQRNADLGTKRKAQVPSHRSRVQGLWLHERCCNSIVSQGLYFSLLAFKEDDDVIYGDKKRFKRRKSLHNITRNKFNSKNSEAPLLAKLDGACNRSQEIGWCGTNTGRHPN